MGDSALVKPSARPLYVIIMTHVEGDAPDREGSTTYMENLSYQVGELPPVGQKQQFPTFELDLIGTEFLHEFLESYTDSLGKPARLFIEPTGEFWQTEADSYYGGKLFRKYDYLAAGCEFGIQGHAIRYSGKSFCWYETPPTEEGIRQKLTDLHEAAERVWYKGQKVNAALTFTGGHKLETGRRPARLGLPPMDPREAERAIDTVAYELGYRISFEDYDGHFQSKPSELSRSCPAPYIYEADYGDGVRMVKIDFHGSLRDNCPGNVPRCETSAEALTRFDRTVAAKDQDDDPAHIYFFAFTVHSNLWNEVHLEETGNTPVGEWAALQNFMNGVEERKNAGTRIEYVMPRTLAEHFWAAQRALNP